MVRRLVWDQKIGGSSPPSPIVKILVRGEGAETFGLKGAPVRHNHRPVAKAEIPVPRPSVNQKSNLKN